MADDQEIRLVFRTDTAAIGTAKGAVDSLKDSTDRLEKSTANMGQAALQGGRALQDFAQGGVGGILNNIEGLTSALGGGPGLAGVMTAVGLAAYFAMPLIKSFFSEARDNPIPETANNLKAMEERLRDVTKQLGELREKQMLTNSEFAEFNRLTEEGARLEREAKERKKEEADASKLRGMTDPSEAKKAQEAAKAMQEMFGGQTGDLVSRVAATLDPKERDAALRSVQDASDKLAIRAQALERAQAETPPSGLADRLAYDRRIGSLRSSVDEASGDLAGARARADEAQEEMSRRARGVVADAMERGQVGRLLDVMGRNPEMFTERQRRGAFFAGPEGRAVAEGEMGDAEWNKELLKGDKAAQKRAFDALVDDWSQGLEDAFKEGQHRERVQRAAHEAIGDIARKEDEEEQAAKDRARKDLDSAASRETDVAARRGEQLARQIAERAIALESQGVDADVAQVVAMQQITQMQEMLSQRQDAAMQMLGGLNRDLNARRQTFLNRGR